MRIPAVSFRELLDIPPWELRARTLRPVRVAVLDTGIDATHEALRGRIVRAAAWRKDGEGNIVSTPLSRQENNDPSGHGTGVAGVVAAIAPCAEIEDMRVLDADNGGFGSVVLAGLRAAIQGDAEVINVSVAFEKNRWWNDAARLLEEACLRGKIVVASKRNFPRPGDLGLPAELSTVVGVDIGDFDNPWLLRFFRNAPIEFAASGNAVLTARSGGGWTRLTGTSFATPVVASLCILLRGANRTLSLFEIKSILKHWATAGQTHPDSNPLETARSQAALASGQSLVPWTCPLCGASRFVPDAFPSVRCEQCGKTTPRAVLLDPGLYTSFLEEFRRTIPPQFSFHNADHARDVVEAVYAILPRHPGLATVRKREILFAALLHDYGYAENPDDHEEASAMAAADIARIRGHSVSFAENVANLIRATRPSHIPTTLPEKIIRDADLFHIGTSGYRKRAAALRAELAARGRTFTDAEWCRREADFLSSQRFHLPWLERERKASRAVEISRLRRMAGTRQA